MLKAYLTAIILSGHISKMDTCNAYFDFDAHTCNCDTIFSIYKGRPTRNMYSTWSSKKAKEDYFNKKRRQRIKDSINIIESIEEFDKYKK